MQQLSGYLHLRNPLQPSIKLLNAALKLYFNEASQDIRRHLVYDNTDNRPARHS